MIMRIVLTTTWLRQGSTKAKLFEVLQEARERIGPGLYRTDVDVFANAGKPNLRTSDITCISSLETAMHGAGLFHPSKAALANLRRCMVDDPLGIKELVNEPEFKEMFADGLVTRKALNTVPDGFDNDDPAAEYLKMVGLGCHKDLPDALLLEDDVIEQLIDIFRSASPLVRYFE